MPTPFDQYYLNGTEFLVRVQKERESVISFIVYHFETNRIIAHFAMDPLDNTIVGALTQDQITTLGDKGMKSLSNFIRAQLGAKEFILVPPGAEVLEFTTPELAKTPNGESFTRTRYGNRTELSHHIHDILISQHLKLCQRMYGKFQHLYREDILKRAAKDPLFFTKLLHFLTHNARYLDSKMAEYASEKVQGMKARFLNQDVIPLVILDEHDEIVGCVRFLQCTENLVYMSEETILRQLVPEGEFQSASQRENFLFAFLLFHALNALPVNFTNILTIAGNDHVERSSAVGFEAFPLSMESAQALGAQVVMKLGKPGPLLEAVKAAILQPELSFAQVLSASRGYAAPSTVTADGTAAALASADIDAASRLAP